MRALPTRLWRCRPGAAGLLPGPGLRLLLAVEHILTEPQVCLDLWAGGGGAVAAGGGSRGGGNNRKRGAAAGIKAWSLPDRACWRRPLAPRQRGEGRRRRKAETAGPQSRCCTIELKIYIVVYAIKLRRQADGARRRKL